MVPLSHHKWIRQAHHKCRAHTASILLEVSVLLADEVLGNVEGIVDIDRVSVWPVMLDTGGVVSPLAKMADNMYYGVSTTYCVTEAENESSSIPGCTGY